MSDRKQTPDILAEILNNAAPATPGGQVAPAIPVTQAPARKPRQTATPKSRPAAPKPPVLPMAWNYLIVSFQEHDGWRVRYINGRKVKDWANGLTLQEYILQAGIEGWELAAACSGTPLFGKADSYQLFFKQPVKG